MQEGLLRLSDAIAEKLPPELEIALAHTPVGLRDALRVFFEFDQRLGRIIAATTEPMLGQMRLAWWRDNLGMPAAQRPSGDAVLDGIGRHWQGREAALVACVDGWERMLDPPPLTKDAALELAKGRAAPFLAAVDLSFDEEERAQDTAKRWALVDAALNTESGDERSMMLDLGRGLTGARALPKSLRGLAVLDALVSRSLKRGGRPLMEGRSAALVATRAAIFGR